MIDINELRPAVEAAGLNAISVQEVLELLDRLEAAEKERDWNAERLEEAIKEWTALRAKIEAMERQEPVAWVRKLGLDLPSTSCVTDLKYRPSNIPESAYIPLYTLPGAHRVPSFADAYQGAMGEVAIWKRRALEAEDLNRKFIAEINGPMHMGEPAQPAPSVPECPYPCGWRNLLKLAIEDGAYLARSINEDEPVTENARAVTMRTVLRLRDVLMALNNATPEAKP